MFLFKTSGATFASVIANQKHAFKNKPISWRAGEIILVSKNKGDLGPGEKQISYIMRISDIKPTDDIEVETYWPGNPGRWNYIVHCQDTESVKKPFNLEEVLGTGADVYKPVMTYRRVNPEDEVALLNMLGLGYTNTPDEIDDPTRYKEGACRQISVNAYERDPTARNRCIEHHGVACKACGFDFAKSYGEHGQGYIHVHHIVPLAEVGGQYEVDPYKDLVPLCANCHAMVHRRRPALKMDELKSIMQRTING